ncbi:hypothetical protein GQ457_05G010170 [Hibiscus cannabinus]
MIVGLKDLGPPANHVLTMNAQSLPLITVADMVDEEGNWRWAVIDQILHSYVLLQLAAIKGHLPAFAADSVAWAGTNSGKFTITSAYSIHKGIVYGPEEDLWKLVHRFRGTKHMKFFFMDGLS